jgi:multiple sugar transport system substrate-binding protein
MGLMKRGSLGVLAGAVIGLTTLWADAPSVRAEDVVLRMAVPDWPPTRIMKDLADKEYKAPSGNKVTLEPDFIPWPDYYTRLAASLTSGEKKYQMAVSDSQWLGAFVEGGYYLKINDFIDKDPELQAIFKDLNPNLVAAYSTYPHKSENYYGFPQMPDVLITYYRKDVFCNAEEQAAFQAKYGKKLPCTPQEMNDVDWDMWGQFGEFFRRKGGDKLAGAPLADDFYGIAYQAGKGYDFSMMQINGFLWQMGADIWDETKAPKAQADGVVNSDAAVKAFEKYLSLLQYAPPVAMTGTMDIFKTDELFREGKVAAIIQWIGFGESAISPQTSKVADKVDFAMMPGTRGADGKLVRWSNIGGQPFVLTTWNDDTVTKEALDFVKWWLSKDTQTKFAAAGGQSGLKSVYSTPEYQTYRPWNHAFGPSLDWQKDVWHVPEFYELLVNAQENYDKAITGQVSAKEALDAIATFEQKLLTESGLIEE